MMTTQTRVHEICPTTAQAWVERGAFLVDVRESEEVEQLAFDVPHLLAIPLSEFEFRYKELPVDQPLVVVCRDGSRSLRAANFLINHGYDTLNVVNMQHGIIRWVQKGFPTKGDAATVAGNFASASCCSSTTPEKQ